MINWLTCSKKKLQYGPILITFLGPRKMIEHAQLGALWFSGTPRKINGMYDKVLKTKARANPPAALRMWNSLLILRHFWSQKLGWRRLGFKNSLSSPWNFNKAPLPTASPAPAQTQQLAFVSRRSWACTHGRSNHVVHKNGDLTKYRESVQR